MLKRSLVVSALLTAVACGGSGDAALRVQVDTLPSGLVRVANDGHGLWTPETAWTIEEDLRIGRLDAVGPEQFAQIWSVLADDTGAIYVFEAQAGEVRVFDAGGQYSHTIGRRGEGPGELGSSWGLNIGPDGNLWVWDVANRRYSVFNTDGSFVTSYVRQINGVLVPWNGGFDSVGRYVDWGLNRPRLRSDQPGPRSWLLPIRFTPPNVFDTLPALSYEAETTAAGVRKTPSKGLMLALSREGRLWFAHTDEYTIFERTLEGDTVRSFSIPSRPVAISEHEIDSMRALYTERGAEFDPGRVASHKRLVTRIRADNSGHLYVVPNEPDVPAGTAVDVFQDSGEYLGRVSLPEPIEYTSPAPYITRDYFYAVVTDDLDVPYVVRWRIRRP